MPYGPATITERLRNILRGAELSPRNLSAVAKVHFTTIYKLMKEDRNTFPSVEKTLSDTLDKIEKLHSDGHLPFRDAISDKEKTRRLASMLAANN